MIGEQEHSTRCFAAGQARFTVRCPSQAVVDAVEALFVDLMDATADGATEMRLVSSTTDGWLALHTDDREHGAGPADGALADLITVVNRLSLDREADRLHLHCAAMSLDDQGVLISAASGTGKTTLAAALARSGWTYLSDEAVAIEPGSTTAFGFPKPLVIKPLLAQDGWDHVSIDASEAASNMPNSLTIQPGGRELLPGIETARVTLQTDDNAAWTLVPASALGAPTTPEVAPVVLILLYPLPDGTTDGAPVVSSVHAADAVVALMAQTMDAERFGDDAVMVLADLASRCRCVSMSVAPLDATISVIEELLQSAPPAEGVAELVHSGHTASEDWCLTPHVRSFLMGDRAVVYDTKGGAIVALDEAGTAAWQALHGTAPSWWPLESMKDPQTAGFFEQLVAHGLLERATPSGSTGA